MPSCLGHVCAIISLVLDTLTSCFSASRYFHCGDLGRDLVPVVQAFKASKEATTLVPAGNVVADADRPWHIDTKTVVPDPFPFETFLAAHEAELSAGASLQLFGEDHPDHEFSVRRMSEKFHVLLQSLQSQLQLH